MAKTKIKFQKKEESRAGKTFILINYSGGDADTDHPEEYLLDIPFEANMTQNDKIDEIVSEYKTLKEILDDTDIKYSEVEKEYGTKMARLYDNAPNDPQCDYQYKCTLDSIQLIGYDDKGTKYMSYL